MPAIPNAKANPPTKFSIGVGVVPRRRRSVPKTNMTSPVTTGAITRLTP